MKHNFSKNQRLAFANLAITLSFNFVNAQTLYTPSGTVSTSTTSNIGVNIANPETPFHLVGEFKMGTTAALFDRQKSILKFGDGNFVKVGEWEIDDQLSFFAFKGYNFTGGTFTTSGMLSCGNIISRGADFVLGINDGRFQGIKPAQRALGHEVSTLNDILVINYGGDFEDGTVNGNLFANSNFTTGTKNGLYWSGGLIKCGTIISHGADFVLGLNDGRFQGTKIGQRALVHEVSTIKDILVINYGGDFEDGTLVQSDLSIGGKLNVGNVNFNNVSGTQLEITGALRVKGKLAVQEVCVSPTAEWCDYVFEKDYKLMPLIELGKYVKANKHLPEIPTTAEVEKSGVNIGDMNVLLLKKMEEMTLYVLQLEERLKFMETQKKE